MIDIFFQIMHVIVFKIANLHLFFLSFLDFGIINPRKNPSPSRT